MAQGLDEGSVSSRDVPAAGPNAGRSSIGYILITLVLIALVGGAYWLKTRPSDATASQEALMKEGLDALYTKKDPAVAAARFRKVLELSPTHYGATYQLAMALDGSGKPAEALVYWQKMLPLAEAANDAATIKTVRTRLEGVPKSADDPAKAQMTAGLAALYDRNDPKAAAVEFRKVLEQNPTHYGATYQLATALDRDGKAAEARALWEKVLKMAEGYKDQATVDAARSRLAKNP